MFNDEESVSTLHFVVFVFLFSTCRAFDKVEFHVIEYKSSPISAPLTATNTLHSAKPNVLQIAETIQTAPEKAV